MHRKNKKHKIVAFLFSIILIGIGYAYLTANLKITGTTKIGNARFDVHFKEAEMLEYYTKNVSFESNSNSNIKPGTPIIKGENNTELEWNVTIDKPGANYQYASEIVNAGDIDAELDLDSSIIKIKIGNDEEQTYKFNDIKQEYYYETGFLQHLGPVYAKIYFTDRDYKYINAGKSKTVYGYVYLDDETITNEQWESYKNKDIKITVDLKYIQGDNNPHSNEFEPYDYEEGNMKVRIDNVVAEGAGSTTTFPSNSNSNNIPNPSITNRSLAYNHCIYSDICSLEQFTEHEIEYELFFNSPGDYYEYSFDIINEEDYDIEVWNERRTMKIGVDVEEVFNPYTTEFKYYFSFELTDNDDYSSIPAHGTAHVKVKIGLRDDIDQDEADRFKGRLFKIKSLFHAREDKPYYDGTK